MGGMSTYGSVSTPPELKRKREDSGDIPRPFLRGGAEASWSGAATGANAIGVKKLKPESP
jgi:hypothetical protein